MIRLTTDVIDDHQLTEQVRRPDCGAVVTFLGTVRDLTGVAELDPAVFVLDCLPNMNAAQIRERVEPGVLQLRKARPRTPILLVEDRNYADNPMNVKRQAGNDANHAALREVHAKLRRAGVTDLAYLPGAKLLGADREDTVDGSHPNDLGFQRQADAFEPILRSLMEQDG